MPSTANEYTWLVYESAWTVPVASPVVGTNQFLIPAPESNSTNFNEDPTFVETAFGGGEDTPAEVQSDMRTVKGTLSTMGWVGLAPTLLKSGFTRVNAGQTLPWVTTEPVADLASYSIYKMIRGRDGAWIPYAYPGCKTSAINLTCSRQDPRMKLKLDVIGQKEFPNAADSSAALTPPAAPTDAQYPRGIYLFSQSAGGILYGGSALTRYLDLSITLTNKMDPQWFESKWIQTLGCHGRECTADMTLLLTSTANNRATYQAVTRQAFSVVFTAGANTVTINMNGNVYMSKMNFDLPLGKEFMQKCTFKGLYDVSVGSLASTSNT